MGDVLLGRDIGIFGHCHWALSRNPKRQIFVSLLITKLGENSHFYSPWLAISCLWFKTWPKKQNFGKNKQIFRFLPKFCFLAITFTDCPGHAKSLKMRFVLWLIVFEDSECQCWWNHRQKIILWKLRQIYTISSGEKLVWDTWRLTFEDHSGMFTQMNGEKMKAPSDRCVLKWDHEEYAATAFEFCEASVQ